MTALISQTLFAHVDGMAYVVALVAPCLAQAMHMPCSFVINTRTFGHERSLIILEAFSFRMNLIPIDRV